MSVTEQAESNPSPTGWLKQTPPIPVTNRIQPPNGEEAPKNPVGFHDLRQNRGRAVRGIVWISLGFAAGQVLRFAFNLLLARLLVPEVFGIMALVNTVLAGLQIFSETGIAAAIIQNKSGDEERFLNTAWTVQVLRGLLLWAFSALLAWPMAVFYQTPLLLGLLPAVGTTAAIAGFNSTSLQTLARHLVRGPLVILGLASYIAGTAVTIGWVFLVKADVWGFVVGSIVSALITLMVSYWLIPQYKNRFCWDKAFLREQVHFGKWIFVRIVCSFLGDQTDRLIVGKVASLAVLGVYQISHQLSWMPVAMLYAISTQVVFPIYSRRYHSEQRIRAELLKFHPLLAIFAALTASTLAVTGPILIDCLYESSYQSAGWMVSLMAVGAFFKMLESAATTSLMGLGNTRAPALGNAVKAGAIVVLLPTGYFFGGMVGLLLALASTDVIRYVIIAWALHRQGESVLRCDFTLLLCALTIAAIVYTASVQLGAATNHWIKLVASIGMILILWSGVALAAWGRPWIWGWTVEVPEESRPASIS